MIPEIRGSITVENEINGSILENAVRGYSPYELAKRNGFVGTEEEWLASLKGDKGDIGLTPDISIGNVTTGQPGTNAEVSVSGTPENPVMDFTIPRGDVGATPNMTIGTVATGEEGTQAQATITGTPENPVLNLTIPKGDTGDDGFNPVVEVTKDGNTATVSVTDATHTTEVNIVDGYTPQKNVDYFDGHSPQITGAKSQGTTFIYSDGEQIGAIVDGQDGYTPRKGVDYFDGHTPVIAGEKIDDTTFIYADGVRIATVLDGLDGNSPVITTVKSGKTTSILADSVVVGTVSDGADGHSPTITTTKSGKTTTILSDGTSIGTISDGQDGHSPEITTNKVGKVLSILSDGQIIGTVSDGADGQDAVTPTITTDKSGTTTTIYSNGVAIGTVEDGADGTTPVITATKSEGITTIKANGVDIATINDGTSGEDGYSPTASVSKSSGVSTLTVTDESGTTSVQISDGTGMIASDPNNDGNIVLTSMVGVQVDTEPIQGSTNTISSGGVYNELTDVRSDINQLEEYLRLHKTESKSVSSSFTAWSRTPIFSSINLEAGKTYRIIATFPSVNTVGGYLAVGKTDNTSPDYANTSVADKQIVTLTYTPESDLTCNIAIRFSESITTSFTCTWGEYEQPVIEELDERIDKVDETLDASVMFSYTKGSGYIGETGSISSAGSTSQEVYTSLIPVERGMKFLFSLKHQTSKSNWCAYGLYDSSQTFIKRVVFKDNVSSNHIEDTIDIIDSTAKYISFTWRTYGTGVESIVNMVGDVQTDIFRNIDVINDILNLPEPARFVDYSGSFGASSRKSIFPSITLRAGKTYSATVEFATTNTEIGYLGISKLDNSSPDYAGADLVNKKKATLLYSPENDLECNITVRFANAGTYSFTCAIEDVTQNAIDDLYSVQENIEDNLNDAIGFQYTKSSGYIGGGGSISSASAAAEVYTSLIPITKGFKVEFTLQHKNSHENWCAYGLYDSSQNFIRRVVFKDAYVSDTVSEVITFSDETAKYVSFTWRTFNDGTEKIKCKIVDMENELFQNGTVDLSDLPLSPGYIDEYGRVNTPGTHKEVHSPKIYGVSSISLIVSTSASVSNAFSFAAYDENGFISGSRQSTYKSGTRVSEQYTCPAGTVYVRYSFRTDDTTYTVQSFGTYDTKKVSSGIGMLSNYYDHSRIPSLNLGLLKPCYDHLFVSRQNIIDIPSESIYHVRISKNLGFNMIEANVQTTSDGVLFVHHMSVDRKFGTYFKHVDGTTDISDIACNTVTWAWIEENVRYNTRIEKFKTRPVLLSEFLAECKKQGLYVFITAESQAIVDMARQYMGNMFIAYSATRALCPTEVIYHWRSAETTKNAVLNYCNKFGAPFIYGMARPDNFTDEQLKEIVDTLHQNGYQIGTSYQDANWHKYESMGFDFNGTQTCVNRIENGNLYNFSAIYDYNDFTYTNATESNGVLTYSADGTLEPNVSNTTYTLAMIDVEIWFDGTITLIAIGEMLSDLSLTSDGTESVFRAIPIVNGTVGLSIAATSGTKIYDIKFKASNVLS